MSLRSAWSKATTRSDGRLFPCPKSCVFCANRLGFDYGKFDFVMHEGRAVLLDANKTPGRARNLSKIVAAGTANLADGFEGLIHRVAGAIPRKV